VAQTPVSRLIAQFNSYDDMIDSIIESIVSKSGGADYIGKTAKMLYSELHPIARSTYKHGKGTVVDTKVKPHKMVVDCIYLVCNTEGMRVSIRDIETLMDKLFKVKVRPEPHKWITPHLDRVCEILKCCPDDLPVRGTTGEAMEGSGGSATHTL
jgi:hypothetical protein